MKKSLAHRFPSRTSLMSPFEDVFNDFWNSFFNQDPLSVSTRKDYPKINVHKTDTDYVLTVSCPGMTEDDVEMEISHDNVLSIRGRMSEEHREPEGSVSIYREIKMSAFERQVLLPKEVTGDPVASMKDGMLKLTWVLQEEEKPEVRKISINSKK